MASSASLLFHPLALLLIGNQVIALTAGFTSSHSFLRPLIFLLLIAYICTGLSKYSNYTYTTTCFGAILGGSYANSVLVYWDRLLLRQWAFADRHSIFPAQFAGKQKKQERNDEHDKDVSKQLQGASVLMEATRDTLEPRFAFGNKIAGSGRMIDTPWEAKNVPPPAASDPNNDVLRASTVAQKTLSLAASLVLREITMEAQMSIDPFYTAPARVSFLTRLNEVTRGEVLVRVVLGIGQWIDAYCVLQALLSTGTILLVLLNPDKVRTLRPLFGPISEAYSLRGFWG